MFWFSIDVYFGLDLLAAVALDPAHEVVVLALRADPAAIREAEVLLLGGAVTFLLSNFLRVIFLGADGLLFLLVLVAERHEGGGFGVEVLAVLFLQHSGVVVVDHDVVDCLRLHWGMRRERL